VACDDEEKRVEAAATALAGAEARCGLTLAKHRDDPANEEVQACERQINRARESLRQAQQVLAACRATEVTRLKGAKGFVSFLRVHEIGSGFGGGDSNFLDADVVFKLDREPAKAFGFQLRDDENRPIREGMLALLREAATIPAVIEIEYLELVIPPNQNSFVFRMNLTPKPPPLPDIGVITGPGTEPEQHP
jgi:hypothetical protein